MKEINVTSPVEPQHNEFDPSGSNLKAGSAKSISELEKVISAGLRHFVDVGRALSQINQHELFKPTFKSFQEYCEVRWGFKKSYAHHLIAGAAVVEDLPGELSTIVENESQARVLAGYNPEERVVILEHLQSKGEQITAPRLKEAAKTALRRRVGKRKTQAATGKPSTLDEDHDLSPTSVEVEDNNADLVSEASVAAIYGLLAALYALKPVAPSLVEIRDRLGNLEIELHDLAAAWAMTIILHFSDN